MNQFEISTIKTGSGLFRQSLFTTALILLLSACGGSENDGAPVEQPATTVSTEVLQRNAADNASKAISTNVDTMLQSLIGSTAVNTTLTSPGISQLFSSGEQPAADDPNGNLVLNDDLGVGLDSNVSSIMRSTLGLEGNAQSARSGDTITIDPDERNICENELLDANADSVELQQCVDLLSDLVVEVNATTDQRGTINYLFQGQPVVLISYAPLSGSYELNLAGARAVMVRMAELEVEAEPVPEIMQGAIRIAATVLNDTPEAESVNFALSITEQLNIVDSTDGTDVSIAPSTLFSISADAGAGTARAEVAIGALQISSTDTDSNGASFLNTLAMAGASFTADLQANGNVLRVTNLGIGRGPLTLSVNSTEVLRVTLETFGFTVDDNSGQITLDGALDLSVASNNFMNTLDAAASANATAQYTASAPAGTVMTERSDDALQVLSGGPFVFNYDVFDGANSAMGTITVTDGNCFTSDNSPAADVPLVAANCVP